MVLSWCYGCGVVMENVILNGVVLSWCYGGRSVIMENVLFNEWYFTGLMYVVLSLIM